MSDTHFEAGQQRRLVFMHIPKTGGTSLYNILAQVYPPEQFCPMRFSHLHEMPPEEREKYRIYSGHYFYDQLAYIPRPATMITFLRDPRQRLLSLYYFYKAHPWSVIREIETDVKGPSLAKTMSLRDYLTCPDAAARRPTDNAITRFLVGREYEHESGALMLDPDAAFDTAILHLREFDAYGVLELYEDSRMPLERALGFCLPPVLPHDNSLQELVSAGALEPVERESIDAETEREIDRCTAIDARVYAWALEHL